MQEGSQVKGAVQREFGELCSGIALRHQPMDQKRTGSSAFTCSRQPRRAASMAATSIFTIVIIASKTRFCITATNGVNPKVRQKVKGQIQLKRREVWIWPEVFTIAI